MAREIRVSGTHAAARNQRVIAVGVDRKGNLYAGSSNYFDKGQKAATDRLGVKRVKADRKLHAEEELMAEVDDLVRVGTSKLDPCGPDWHDCLGQLLSKGIEIDNCNVR